ncbi:MAG: hypothetical protein WCH74_01935, partial [Chloroflexota bacterium]
VTSPTVAAPPVGATTPSGGGLGDGVVAPTGGTVTVGDVTLVVPGGAVLHDTRFDITKSDGPDRLGVAPLAVFDIAATDLGDYSPIERFLDPVLLDIRTDGLDLVNIDPRSLQIARLGLGGEWTTISTSVLPDLVRASIRETGAYGVVGEALAPTWTLSLDSDAPSAGRHRVDPGTEVRITLTARPDLPARRATLVAGVPADWTQVDLAGGTYDAGAGEVSWPLEYVGANEIVRRVIILRAPDPSPDSGDFESLATFTARLEQPRAAVTSVDPITVLSAPRIVIEHRVMATVDSETGAVTYETEDAELVKEPKSRVFRIRFRVENPDSVPLTLAPLIQYRDATAPGVSVAPGLVSFSVPQTPGAWVTLPGADDAQGEAQFYAATEARDYTVEEDAIADGETRTHDTAPAGAPAGGASRIAAEVIARPFSVGVRSKGANPARTITIAPDGWTEVEFSVRATIWAEYDGTYELRLTDGGEPIDPSVAATVTIEPDPAAEVFAGQEPQYRLAPPVATITRPITGPAVPTAVGPSLLTGAGGSGAFAHGDASMTTDTCAACHRTHTPSGSSLGTLPLPQSTACFVCHNGTGASSNIAGQYSGAIPNDPTTSSYYQHPASAANSGHTNANLEEFKGVANRHTECADCHNPHSPTMATGDPSTMTPNGWTVPGALGGISGVAVTNGAAGTSPTYALVNTPPSSDSDTAEYPATTQPITFEYQLCLKCHSGYTTLPTQDPTHPSRWALDKGVELNPTNDSYHPVEAAGRNTSTYIACSLSGTCAGYVDPPNAYRLWTPTATDTIRCTQCHGSGVTAATPAGGSLQAHTNVNRGMLTQPYRDRELHLSTERSFVASEFALCFSCHAVAPFDTGSTSGRADTAFRVHSIHLGYFRGSGSAVTNIDEPGAGAGTAICSECHFRTHSTALKYGLTDRTQTGADAGLVNFAPNVGPAPVDADHLGTLKLEWLRTTAADQPTGSGSCTLTCHGYQHRTKTY